MSRFGMIGKIVAQEGGRDELVQILLDATAAMESLAGCELYVVSISDEDPDTIIINEVWKNFEAHQSSLKNEEVRNAIMKGKPLIAAMETTATFTPIGRKGL